MVRITRMTKKRLGELLRDEGLVDDSQIEEALSSQRKTGELLGEVLVRLGYVTEYDIAKTIVTQFGLPYIAVKQYFISDEAMGVFPERLMRQYQFIPLDKLGNVIAIAVGGLLNFDILTELENTSNARIQVYVSTWSEIKTAIDEYFKKFKKPGEDTEAALREMELLAGGTEAPEEAGTGPAAADGAEGKEKGGDLTELGNMLLGDMEGGEAGSADGGGG